MKRYRLLLWSGFAGMVLVVVLGLASLATAQQEIFPFYSWFLFALVPNGKTTYQVLIDRVGPAALPTPRFFNEASDITPHAHSIIFYKVIQRLGKACREGDRPEVERQRRLLDAQLPPGSRYEVVRVHSDPIEQWRSGVPQVRESVETFEVPAVPVWAAPPK